MASKVFRETKVVFFLYYYYFLLRDDMVEHDKLRSVKLGIFGETQTFIRDLLFEEIINYSTTNNIAHDILTSALQ